MPNNLSRIDDQSDLFDAESFEAFVDQRIFVALPRMTTTAQPFSVEDLRAFEASGEHLGLH